MTSDIKHTELASMIYRAKEEMDARDKSRKVFAERADYRSAAEYSAMYDVAEARYTALIDAARTLDVLDTVREIIKGATALDILTSVK